MSDKKTFIGIFIGSVALLGYNYYLNKKNKKCYKINIENNVNLKLENTKWNCSYFNDNKINKIRDYQINFYNDNRINGQESCNTFNGKFLVDNNNISFFIESMTEAYCNVEIELNKVLDKIKTIKIVEKLGFYEMVLLGINIKVTFVQQLSGKVLDYKNNIFVLDKGLKKIYIPSIILNDTDQQSYFDFWGIWPIELNDDIYISTILDYNKYTIVEGRPLRNELNEIQLSKVIETNNNSWSNYSLSKSIKSGINQLNDKQKEEFINHWKISASNEHSSIASFCYTILQMLSFGSPPELIESLAEALIDEIRHSRIALSLASEASRKMLKFDKLNIKNPIDIHQFFENNEEDACINESVSSALLLVAANKTRNNDLSRIIKRMSSDENKHAELGFEIRKWCIDNFSELRKKTYNKNILSINDLGVLDYVTKNAVRKKVIENLKLR